MSLKYHTEKIGPSKYMLPKTGDMRCDVTAFLSEALFQSTNEDLWQDAYRSASYPGAKGVYLMPDCHKGYVLPVGGVLVTDDTIIQAGSGYDISCGVAYLEVPDLHASDIADWDKRQQWVRAVERRVALGVGTHHPDLMKVASHRDMEDIFRYGAKPLGIRADQCERQYIEVGPEFDSHLVQRALNKAAPQLGSVGGGNHFVEMQVDEANGSVWVMVHCGSRGFGWETANHFFHEGAKLRDLQQRHREKAWLRADEPLGKQYWAHHNACANYAVANRWSIVKGVVCATQEIYGATPKPYYEISHNLVQEETLVLPDGTTTRGFVHRKGSTRAFPAGHPDLRGTSWERSGHPCLIPGSMLDGAAILWPQEGAYQSGCSVNHGSGRHMGRAQAKREFREMQDHIDDEMRTITRTLGGVEVTGIVGNTDRTPLDECGHVYKDLDDVLAVLVENGIASIAHRLYPVANLKGVD